MQNLTKHFILFKDHFNMANESIGHFLHGSRNIETLWIVILWYCHMEEARSSVVVA